jgi:hypothetical protein
MSRIRRKGFRREPEGGWPIDEMFVGVATVRTIRELFRREAQFGDAVRAWDLALWSGVSPQGSANSLERLERLGLVQVTFPGSAYQAKEYRLDPAHPLYGPLARLFDAERWAAQKSRPSNKK